MGWAFVISMDKWHKGLACSHMELNKHANVLQPDICDDTAKEEFHLLGAEAAILSSGFLASRTVPRACRWARRTTGMECSLKL